MLLCVYIVQNCYLVPKCLYSIDPLKLEVEIRTCYYGEDREILDALLMIEKNQKLILENLSRKPQAPLPHNSNFFEQPGNFFFLSFKKSS